MGDSMRQHEEAMKQSTAPQAGQTGEPSESVQQLQCQIRQLRSELQQSRQALHTCEEYSAQVVKKLKQSREEFVTIFDSVPAMIWYRDPEGKILRVNQCAADSVGRPIRELVGKNYYDLFPDGAERSRRQDREVIQTGQPIRHQFRRFKAFDGSTHWALVDRIPLRSKQSGTIAGVMVFAQNITDRKKAEDRLVRAKQEIEIANKQLKAAAERARESAERAHRSNQAKSEILATSSHDLRTPMNSILGFADLLLQTELDEEQVDYAKTIHRSAAGLLALINDILEFSKLEAGKMNIDIVACDLPQLIDDIRAMLAPGARGKGLDFNIQIDQRLPQTVFTDPLRLKQCLVNLIGNAVKFTDAGHVALSAILEEQDGQPRMRFDVEDTGIGISEQRQEAIFKSYSQEEVSTARKYGGTGLGLTITKQLTELLGGHVTLKSSQGYGSTFSIVLPLLTHIEGAACGLNRSKPQKRSDDPHQQYDGRILLVEDNIPSRLMLNFLLRRTGLDVKASSQRADLYEKLQKHDIDLILINLSIENGQGIDIVRQLRSRGIEIPVIAVDEHDEIRKEEAFDAGCTEYLTKPLSRRRIYEAIAGVLEQKPYIEGINALRHRAVDSPSCDETFSAAPSGEDPAGEVLNPGELTQMLPEVIQELQHVLADADFSQAAEILNVLTRVAQVWGDAALRQKIERLQDSVLLKSHTPEETRDIVSQLETAFEQMIPLMPHLQSD